MDRTTAQQLIELNRRFYREHAQSFAATRQAPWQGWEQVADIARTTLPVAHLDGAEPLCVLDLACGNMRLLPFLLDAFPHARIDYYGLDGEEALLTQGTPQIAEGERERVQVHARQLDILDTLLNAPGVAEQVAATCDQTALNPLLCIDTEIPSCDLVCCFGFLHHVPSVELRCSLIEMLIACTRPGGMVAISCWRFMDDERLAAQARTVAAAVSAEQPSERFADALEPHDHFLGWQGDATLPRYCHYVDEQELNDLVAVARAAGAEELVRWSADGRTGTLNRYALLRRNS